MDKLYAIFSYPFGWILWLLYQLFDNNYALALIAFTLIAKLHRKARQKLYVQDQK